MFWKRRLASGAQQRYTPDYYGNRVSTCVACALTSLAITLITFSVYDVGTKRHFRVMLHPRTIVADQPFLSLACLNWGLTATGGGKAHPDSIPRNPICEERGMDDQSKRMLLLGRQAPPVRSFCFVRLKTDVRE